MNFFLITLINVAIMIAYSIPGFVLMRLKKIETSTITGFSLILMYVCQPMLVIYAFNLILEEGSDMSIKKISENCGIILGISAGVQLLFIFLFWLILKPKYQDARIRIANIGFCFGNVTFMGMPLLEELYPDNSEVLLYSNVYAISMSLIGWTLVSALIAMDFKYCKIQNFLLNPTVLALIIAIPLFATETKLPDELNNMCTILGKMSTPICMIIIGARLGTVEHMINIINNLLQYIVVFVKLIVFPFFMTLLVYWLPIDVIIKQALVIMAGAPCASMLLGYAELVGTGQEYACYVIILSTFLCLITLPCIGMFAEKVVVD